MIVGAMMRFVGANDVAQRRIIRHLPIAPRDRRRGHDRRSALVDLLQVQGIADYGLLFELSDHTVRGERR